MEHLELAGAPLAWLWLFIVSATVVLFPLLRGLMRRGSGIRHERSFLIQRAPQLAVGLVFTLAMVSFEAIEFSLGTGEPSFGKDLFVRHVSLLPIASLAIVLPANLSAAISWLGVVWTALGSILLISGLFYASRFILYRLRDSARSKAVQEWTFPISPASCLRGLGTFTPRHCNHHTFVCSRGAGCYGRSSIVPASSQI